MSLFVCSCVGGKVVSGGTPNWCGETLCKAVPATLVRVCNGCGYGETVPRGEEQSTGTECRKCGILDWDLISSGEEGIVKTLGQEVERLRVEVELMRREASPGSTTRLRAALTRLLEYDLSGVVRQRDLRAAREALSGEGSNSYNQEWSHARKRSRKRRL